MHVTASPDGDTSKLVISDREGQEMIVAQRQSDLVRVWIKGLGTIGNDAAFVLGRWLAEAEGRLPNGDRRMIEEEWERATSGGRS